MAITISNAYIQTFEDSARIVAQQSSSRLRPFVQTRMSNAAKHNWEIIGSVSASTKSSARTATPTSDTAWTRRVSVPGTYHVGDTVEPEDIVQMLIDPRSPYAQVQGMALERKFDDLIIAAATAAALNGDGTTTAFGAGQTVGDYTTEISFDAVTNIQQLFMANDIDPSVPKVAVVGPKQVRKLMQLTENTSSDYVQANRLQTYGIAPNWLGFTWIMSNRLTVPTTDQLDCLFFTDRAIGLQINQDISTNVAQDPSISFAFRIYSSIVAGAVRVEDKQIVRFKAADTV